MNGVEYDLWYTADNNHLFVIRKGIRTGPKVELSQIYYIIDGTIYQSPDLFTVLSTRVVKFKKIYF
jgi:mediator of RNA polymerase II transcription subunit 6